MEIGFPFRLDPHGRIDSPDYATHVEQLIELLLFTAPGQRVNRPTLGVGLLQLLFDAGSEAETTATEHLTQAALEQWLGDLIDVDLVQVTARGATLVIAVQYVLRATGERRVIEIVPERGVDLP